MSLVDIMVGWAKGMAVVVLQIDVTESWTVLFRRQESSQAVATATLSGPGPWKA